jgi:sulfur carrier protein ThiS
MSLKIDRSARKSEKKKKPVTAERQKELDHNAARAMGAKHAVANRIRSFRDVIEIVVEMRDAGNSYPAIRNTVWSLLEDYEIVRNKTVPENIDGSLSVAYRMEVANSAEVTKIVARIRALPTLHDILMASVEPGDTGVLRSRTIKEYLASHNLLRSNSTPSRRDAVKVAISILLREYWHELIKSGEL